MNRFTFRWVVLFLFIVGISCLALGCKSKESSDPTSPAVATAPAESMPPLDPKDPKVQEIMIRIYAMKGIDVYDDESENEKTNKKLDAVWKFLKSRKKLAVPLLAQELSKELKQSDPDDYFLLDAGYFLLLEGKGKYLDLTLKALETLDPNTDIMKGSTQQLFHCTFGLATIGKPSILPVIDHLFLAMDHESYVSVPQHAMVLNTADICLFLYGAYGPDAEAHLIDKLVSQPEHRLRILHVLNFIGSDQCIEQVMRTMQVYPDGETFSRCAGILIRFGGPKGRDAFLATDFSGFDSESKEAFNEIKPLIEQTTYETLYQQLDTMGTNKKRLSNRVVKKRLKAMYKNFGKDNETNPVALVNADLPKEFMISELVKIRSRMFHRLSNEALQDVQITNLIIKTILYKM